MNVALTTERLLLRRWEENDRDDYARICCDPEVMRWIGDGSVKTPAAAADEIEAFERAWEDRGFGLFALELVCSGRLCGFAGLSVPRFLPEILPAVEIGWRLARDEWGKGLATEAAHRVMDFGFKEIGLERVVSICHVDNRASRRVMDKLGMRLERSTRVPETGVPVEVCEILSTEWISA